MKLGLAAMCVVLAAAGCTSPDPVAYKNVASAGQLAPNPQDTTGRVPFRYATAAKWADYQNVLIDPVVVYRGDDAQFGKMSDADKTQLASYMQVQFAEKLKNHFTLVTSPQPQTLVVRLTLTGAATNFPLLGTVSRLDPGAAVINLVQTARDREGTLTGSVLYTVELYDAATDKLLGAHITKQYPTPYKLDATWGSLAAAKAGIEKGADALAAELAAPATN